MSRNLRLCFLCGFVFLVACKPRFFKSSTASMEETIKQGEKIYVEPTTSFKHNDIVVFSCLGKDYTSRRDETGDYPLKKQIYVYRIVALSGDIFSMTGGEVFLNNV